MEGGTRNILIYRPWQLRAALAVILVLLLAGSWLVFDLGRHRGGVELTELRGERQRLRSEITRLEQEQAALRERLAVAERTAQIERKAYRQVQTDLGKLQDELSATREDLEFYRGIVSPADGGEGLRIHRLTVRSAGTDGAFQYRLTLTQVKKHDQVVSGVVNVQVGGVQDGAERRLALEELTEPAVKELAFRFRYFQYLDGELHLPAGFQPRSFIVEVVPSGRGRAPIEQVFDWPV